MLYEYGYIIYSISSVFQKAGIKRTRCRMFYSACPISSTFFKARYLGIPRRICFTLYGRFHRHLRKPVMMSLGGCFTPCQRFCRSFLEAVKTLYAVHALPSVFLKTDTLLWRMVYAVYYIWFLLLGALKLIASAVAGSGKP